MRIVALLFLFLASAAGQQTPAQNPSTAGQSNQQKARAIIDQMIQALGGQAYLTYQDSYTEGRLGAFHNENLTAWTLYYRYWEWPDKERTELTQQRDVVELYLGGSAYEITYKGIQMLDPAKDDKLQQALIRRHYSLENVLRGWLSEPGVLLMDEGPSLSEGQMAEKITIINAKNEAVTLLVSPDTHLPMEKRFSTRDPRYRDRDEESTIYGNWKVIQGINTPRILLTKRNGAMVSQQIALNVTYNNHPADVLFDPKMAKINPVKQ
ncbi:MAG TPA: hypothetical protein VKH81_01680 [Candidatus Angelobacter sp.]|nr:hypothetical protein [Candidatus Angelobacter sp.]